jgi:hypothetical protein
VVISLEQRPFDLEGASLSTQIGRLLPEQDLMPLLGQLIRCGQPRQTAAHDTDLHGATSSCAAALLDDVSLPRTRISSISRQLMLSLQAK